MEPNKVERSRTCHLVVMPYPGRGHINPMMNLCKLLSSRKPGFLFTFVLTEEWYGFICSDEKPDNVLFRTIPNVIPSELGHAEDFHGFLKAVGTKMEAPFEQLLDQLDRPVDAIISDTYLNWVVNVGNRRNIPVASLWPMSATVFSIFHHFQLLVQNNHFSVDLSERGRETVDYIPGVSSMRLADFPSIFYGTSRELLPKALEPVSMVSKAQYLLFTSIYELEASVIDVLRTKFPFPVYPVGAAFPCIDHADDDSPVNNGNQQAAEYLEWLNSQPEGSVLYISMGSFLSVSSAQMDEIVAGVQNSGVRFLWVSRSNTTVSKEGCCDRGCVVPWCDQLRVLCSPAVGGFWTHCGWNSTLEAIYAGVPMITAPIFMDQQPNSKRIVEDWKIGWRLKKEFAGENLVTREEIANLVESFMDQNSREVIEMKERSRQLQSICKAAIAKDGSSHNTLDSFISDICQGISEMKSCGTTATRLCHLVAMPYPGRGHINPLMNFCKSLVSRADNILVTFVVTEEWFGFIDSDPKPDRFRFRTIPNVIPSELVRAKNMKEFSEALSTKVEAPFEQLLDKLEQPAPSLIIADTLLPWVVGVGNRRNLPVASFWTMSATTFSIYHHLDLLREKDHIFPDLLERGYERVDYIPGVSSTRLVDLPTFLTREPKVLLGKVREDFSQLQKVQYILLSSIYELEPHTIDALKREFSFPIYSVGPATPYADLEDDSSRSIDNHDTDYFRWLDNQPSESVLYVTTGSFLSFSIEQMDEIAAGLRDSGVRYLWVVRGEALSLKEGAGDRGLVVEWCDQLRVLRHPSIGGFWTHCGWNSILEGVYAGIPFLTFPIIVDQFPNSKLVVEDWRVGWRVQKEYRQPNLVTRTEIAELVHKFMDLENHEGKEMRRRAKELQQACQQAVSRDGSSESSMNSFIKDVCSRHFSA